MWFKRGWFLESSQDYSTQEPFLAPTLGLHDTVLDLLQQACKQNDGGSVALFFLLH